uniref:Zinc finger protein 40 n=1 Tax=Cacopsylla melanoneura TaxID=428564 RepID=A0A8D8ZML7_9HEMI
MEVQKLKETSEGDLGAFNFGNGKNHLETAARIFLNSSASESEMRVVMNNEMSWKNSSRQTDSSKLASALLRPKFTQMSSSNSLPDDGDQPLNLTVKSSSSDEKQSIPMSRKRPLPEDDYSSNALNLKREPKMKCLPSNHNVTGPPLFLNSDYGFDRKCAPIKVSPPLPSPGPLLGSTPLVDPRSHIPTLRSLEELSRAPMRQQCHMFGGEVQIRDAIGDAKTVRIEPNKMKTSRENSTKVVTTAKSTGLGSGGTTILQVPQPSESAQVPRLAHQASGSSMLLLPPHSKLPTPTVPGVGSPSPLTSSYNGGVVTLLHGGRAIPHVPGIPGPLSLQIEPPASPVKSKLSAEVKPIIKNGRIPALSEPVFCRVETQDVKPSGSQLEEHSQSLPTSAIHPLIPHLILSSSSSSDPTSSTSESAEDKPSRFLRPSSLPLKPGTYTPKRHLSSTAAQSLVSPETPRPRKGFGQLYLNGHAYTYLGLKCSTRLFFCTLNKPQPLYAPLSPEHQKVSMYSNWKICSEVDPNPLGLTPAQMMAHYSSSSRPSQYTMAQTKQDLLVTHSSYWVKRKQKLESPATSPDQEEEEKVKLSPEQQEVKVKLHQEIRVRKDLASDTVKSEPISPVNSSISPSIPVGALVPEVVMNEEEPVSVPVVNEEKPKRRKIFTGGFESTEDYIYIRGRVPSSIPGRGRFVCEECGIRCRKPSMLKKHIRTHSDVRLYTCNTCKFSFKTKGNLTKHMKSKAHYKKCAELGVSPMPSSEELSGDEKQEDRNSHSSESTEPGDTDEDCDEEEDEDEDEEDYDDDEEEYDEDMENEEEEEDGERINSELEHDVAHSLLSLAGMTPNSESAGLSVSTARPTTYPYSGCTTPTTNTTVTISTSTICSSSSSTITCTTSTITVPSAFSVSALPTVRDSEKAAMSILPPQPPTSPNSQDKRPRAEFLPPSSGPTPTYVSVLKDGRSMCGICNKIFTKPSQLRLHVNIHYFERPFRCEACAVSFRTKGHLQKHQRSSSHLNKVNMNSTFGTPTTTNPRPFKCEDCKIAFRIHGHLAKHLRSKMHIMKLECGGKLPFGTYAELERCGYNLNDIDTTDCDNSLESLQLLAQKLYEKDPSKLGGWGPEMLPHSNGVGPPHTSGESSDEGESLEPGLGSPIHKTEPQPQHVQMDNSPIDVKSC